MRGRTVLYVHGLEAGPEGRKSVELRRMLTIPSNRRNTVKFTGENRAQKAVKFTGEKAA